jgi:2,3-bisphosphoglycerate-dependent phosphoglycerate mutase
MAKKIYLVRHGETNSNVSRAWQDPDEHLNDNGLAQAELVATRLRHLKVDRIITSTMPRALQTTEKIVSTMGLSYDTSDLLREIKVPTSLIAAPFTEEAGTPQQQFISQRLAYASDATWHFEDEENPTEFLFRVKSALKFLTEQNEDSLLVVTHGGFLRCVLGYIITEGNCDATDVYRFFRTIKTTNTGITVLQYDEKGWVLRVFNDHAHFAE